MKATILGITPSSQLLTTMGATILGISLLNCLLTTMWTAILGITLSSELSVYHRVCNTYNHVTEAVTNHVMHIANTAKFPV